MVCKDLCEVVHFAVENDPTVILGVVRSNVGKRQREDLRERVVLVF